MRPPQVVLAEGLGWAVEPRAKRGVPSEGRCGWCGADGPLIDAIPSEFSQWQLTGVNPAEPWLCPLCAGALVGLKPVRWGHATVTTAGEAIMSSDPTDLRAWLLEPVGPTRCVMVQANRQKRSVLASAWGVVATTYDTPGLGWGAVDADRLACHNWLRWGHGVSEREIVERAPRSSTLAASPDPAELLELWHHVKGWDAVRLEISCLATRRPKG